MSFAPYRPPTARSTPPFARPKRNGLTVIEATMSAFVAGVTLTLAIQSYHEFNRWQRNFERRELASLEATNVLEREFQRLARLPAMSKRDASNDATGAANNSPLSSPSSSPPATASRREEPPSQALAAVLPEARVIIELTPGDASLRETRINVAVVAPGPEHDEFTWATLTAWQYSQEKSP